MSDDVVLIEHCEPDCLTRHLGPVEADLFFHIEHDRIELLGSDRRHVLRRRSQTGGNFGPIEQLTCAVSLHDDDRTFFDSFVGCEPSATVETLAAPSNCRPVFR